MSEIAPGPAPVIHHSEEIIDNHEIPEDTGVEIKKTERDLDTIEQEIYTYQAIDTTTNEARELSAVEENLL